MIPNPTPHRTDSIERTTDEEIGLIAAMLRGQIEHMEFRGLNVVRDSIHTNVIELRVMDAEMLETHGGRYATTPFTNPQSVHRWLSIKARYYAEPATMEDNQ